jgi:hypothetical protein
MIILMRTMQEYLLAGGFLHGKINNRKQAYYLYNKLDEEHYVVYVEGNGIKHYMKKFFDVKLDLTVDKMFIMKYGNDTKFKVILDMTNARKLKIQKIPYIKQYYDMALGHIGVIEYAVTGKIHDDIARNVLKTCGVIIFDIDDDYQNQLDLWLDK